MKLTAPHLSALLMPAMIALIAIFAQACSNDPEWNELPRAAAQFVSEYYPAQGVTDVTRNEDGHLVVKLQSGVIITFNNNYDWISVNGYGSTLPQNFLFDRLPPALYSYLQEIESVGDVYRAEQNSREVIVELQSATVIYNVDDGSITVPVKDRTLINLILEL